MNKFKITIDDRPVEVAPGQSVLDAARKLGLDIPTLCHLEKCGPLTTCQVCLIKEVSHGAGRLVPSCGTKAVPGMVIESETEEVHAARRTALELLFSDHVGDCLSPCHRLCPLQLNIPVMIRHIEAARLDEAVATVRQALPLPSVLGRLCHHPCEQGCRRANWDNPAAIREMERFVADNDLKGAEPHLPSRKPASGKSVAVIGAGPAGLAAAYFLARQGHAVTVADRHDQPGGTLRSQVAEKDLPREVLDAELAQLACLGIEFKPGVELGNHITLDGLLRGFDAVLLAIGEGAQREGDKLGVALASTGIKADPNTCRTHLPNVFAAGAAVKSVKQLVRVMSEGKAAAECVHQFLSGLPVRRPDKPFSSVMGRLEKIELKAFLQGASLTPTVAPCDACAGFNQDQAASEALRCLHCDCRSSGHCALQHYAQVYGADANRFRAERRPFEQHLQPGGVIFEPGKCIVCGICVKLTELAQEELGLAFIGRGFDVRVAAPFNRTIEEGLQKVAEECVRHCPTGALEFREETGARAAAAADRQALRGSNPPPFQ
jgi:ferredoxin